MVVFLGGTDTMEEFKRHFVTRLLGKGTVRAIHANDGRVSIVVATNEQNDSKFSCVLNANAAAVAALPLTRTDLLYLLSRVAIAQLQVRGVRRKSGEELILDTALKPWNGDLSEKPFGGPTVGCMHL